MLISSSQLQRIVEEMGFRDHLVHQDLKDFQDHKELKVKLLSNMNLAFQRSMFHYKDSTCNCEILGFFLFSQGTLEFLEFLLLQEV